MNESGQGSVLFASTRACDASKGVQGYEARGLHRREVHLIIIPSVPQIPGKKLLSRGFGGLRGCLPKDQDARPCLFAALPETKNMAIDDIHVAQALNSLKATGLPTCLLVNLGKSGVELRRFGSDPTQAAPTPRPLVPEELAPPWIRE